MNNNETSIHICSFKTQSMIFLTPGNCIYLLTLCNTTGSQHLQKLLKMNSSSSFFTQVIQNASHKELVLAISGIQFGYFNYGKNTSKLIILQVRKKSHPVPLLAKDYSSFKTDRYELFQKLPLCLQVVPPLPTGPSYTANRQSYCESEDEGWDSRHQRGH